MRFINSQQCYSAIRFVYIDINAHAMFVAVQRKFAARRAGCKLHIVAVAFAGRFGAGLALVAYGI